MARKLFDNPFIRWETGKIITKKNDTLVGDIILKEQSQHSRLPRRVKLKDSTGKRKTYSANKISKFSRGENKFVTLEFNGYHYFAQEVFKEELTIYYSRIDSPTFWVTIPSTFVSAPIPLSAKDYFYIKVDNKILGPVMSDNLDSFIKYTCVCDINYKRSKIHTYDIYMILVYLNNQL
jgi:hypothetical protein